MEQYQTCPDCGQTGFLEQGLKTHRGSKSCQRRASTATVSVLPKLAVNLSDISAGEMADAIKSDIAIYERTSREAAFIALRIGLRLIWIRDNEAFGSLTSFIKEHFDAAKSERTLFRYIAITGQFLQESGMFDKKTNKLTGKALEAATPIVTEQLELFTDPEAKLEGALKKLVKWVGDRGLAQIYKGLEATRHSTPPKPTKASAAKRLENQNDEALQLQLLAEHAEENAQELVNMALGEAWKALDSDRLLHFITQALVLASTALPDLASRTACLPALADLENQASRFSEAVAGHIKEARRAGR